MLFFSEKTNICVIKIFKWSNNRAFNPSEVPSEKKCFLLINQN